MGQVTYPLGPGTGTGGGNRNHDYGTRRVVEPHKVRHDNEQDDLGFEQMTYLVAYA